MSIISREFYEDPINFLREKFIEKRANEFDSFVKDVKTKDQVSSKFRTLSDLCSDKRIELAMFEEKLKVYENFDPEVTIFNACRNHGAKNIENVVREITVALLLKQHMPGVVELAKQDLSDCERTFSRFKGEQEKILKELGLT